MTAVRGQTAARPPRRIVRIAWVLHRALYRITGGRVGLRQPVAASTFGMLRLMTIGRRTGRPRVSIVGYYEDGESLVSLAMNGWGTAEPAWWLNLQSSPDALVVLMDGPRSVRARAAAGAERERLWAKVSEYPGWGEDVNALAARRPFDTTVVVFEPRPTDDGTHSDDLRECGFRTDQLSPAARRNPP